MVKAKQWEITTIILASITLVTLGIIGTLGLYAIDLKPPKVKEGDYITIKVFARQFAWRFEYPDGEKLGQLKIKVGQLVKLELYSEDVIHSLYIRELGIKKDVIPGKVNDIWLRVDKAGEFNIFCAEFCGRNHYAMITKLIVEG
ncbi:MAG: cupredoxin domain-containing protein [Nitrososphaerales archaeon]